MKNFDNYLSSVKSFQSSLWKYLASSSIVGLIVVAGQWDDFSKQFNALTELCLVISGMAAILEAYFSTLRHVSSAESEILAYRPFMLGQRALAGLLLSLISFYSYYNLIKDGDESGLIMAMIGAYLFFRVVAQSVKHISIHENQKALWESLPKEERVSWLKNQSELGIMIEHLQQRIEIQALRYEYVRLSIAETNRMIDRSKQEDLRANGLSGKFLAFVYPMTKATLNLRASIGLVSEEERIYLKDLAKNRLTLEEELSANKS